MKRTVIKHVLARLKQLGIRDVFGVPGDYAFPINDAICRDRELRWIGCANELNAAYAADGYARIRGAAALNTTYGVGELSALSGIAGAYAESLPVFHLVGMPRRALQEARALVHHTLGNGEFDFFHEMAAPVVCARAILTPENCFGELHRVVAAAMHHRRPAYLAVPGDCADTAADGLAAPEPPPESDPAALAEAVEAVADRLARAATACVLPGYLLARLGLRQEMLTLLERSGLPFATMYMDKGVLDETHPAYVGMYDGRLMNPEVREFVEGCQCVLSVGALNTDFNSGIFTARLGREQTVDVMHHQVRVGNGFFRNVEMGEFLAALAEKLPRRTAGGGPKPTGLGPPQGGGDEPISAEYLYPRWSQMFRPGDTVVVETGTVALGLAPALLPRDVCYLTQSLWGAIGWATPAALGAAIAAPQRRTILITGEGAQQLTAQEIGTFHRYGVKPILFTLNNHGYLIERLLGRDPEMAYNEIAPWEYAQLPAAMGCKGWMTARVETCGQLDRAIADAEQGDAAAFIEVVTPKYVAPPLAEMFHECAELARR